LASYIISWLKIVRDHDSSLINCLKQSGIRAKFHKIHDYFSKQHQHEIFDELTNVEGQERWSMSGANEYDTGILRSSWNSDRMCAHTRRRCDWGSTVNLFIGRWLICVM